MAQLDATQVVTVLAAELASAVVDRDRARYELAQAIERAEQAETQLAEITDRKGSRRRGANGAGKPAVMGVAPA